MGAITSISLLSGPLPLLLTFGAFSALALAVVGRGRRWWRRVALLAATSLGVVVGVGTVVGIEHRVGSTFPQTFFVWAALPLFAASLAVTGWSSRRWHHRAVSALAVVLLAAFGADTINAHYAYLPTVGDAIGQPIEDQMPAARALAARPRLEVEDHQRGAVVSLPIPGVVSHFHARRAMVWLPPAYFTADHRTFPVVELLAGVPGDPSNLLRAGHVERIADRYARSHAGRAPILVFPDQNGSFLGDTECVDGPRGNAETYLTVDVPTFVQHTFGVAPARDWGIAGYSEGGTCAVTLALRHPDLYAGFLDIAGDLHPNAATGPNEPRLTVGRLYGGSAAAFAAHDPLVLLHRAPASPPLALFAAGDDDGHGLGTATRLAAAFRSAGIDAVLHVEGGGHSFATAHRALADLLPVLADDVGQAAAESSLG